MANLLAARGRIFLKQFCCGQKHCGRAEATLQGIAFEKRRLQHCDFAAVGDTLDGLDLSAVGLDSECQAATHQQPVQADRAGAADAVLAPHMRSGQTKFFTKEINQVLTRLDRPRIYAAIGEPHVAEHLAVKPRMGRQAGHGEIAATPREFGKTRAVIGPDHWHLDRRQHLARLEVGLVKVTEEVGGRDLAAAALGRDFQLGIEREHAGRQFRRRIGMGEAAANGPTVTDGGVRNPGYCLAEHRCGTCNLHRGLDLRISGKRADPQHAVADDDQAAARAGDPYRGMAAWIDVGTLDPFRAADTQLAQELRADGHRVQFHVWPGSHGQDYWQAHWAQYLRFYAGALANCRPHG